MKESIHNYERRLELTLAKIDRLPISESNRKVFINFKNECFSEGLSIGRVLKYLYYLEVLCKWLNKDFKKASKKDLKDLVSKIELSKYAESTKKELKICVKKLYKWIKSTDEYPEIVRWIKPHSNRIQRLKLPEDMLTEEEVKRLINMASSARNKAFVSILYETGCRISEILFLRLKQVKFDDYGGILLIGPMKTGSRRVRIISSVPYITEWINNHPYKEDNNQYLWLNERNRLMRYSAVRSMLNKLGQKAGIKKKFNPHNFRHSRATFMANYLTDAQMKEYFGWTQRSDMAAIYVHLSGRDVDDAILKIHGKKIDKRDDASLLTPKKCQRCKEENPATNKYCSKCGMILDKEFMIQILENDMQRNKADNMLDELIKDPEFKEIFVKKIKELTLKRDSSDD